MAETKTEKTTKVVKYRIKVTANPDFCGVGAGGVQFANGEAVIGKSALVNWYREHKGYEVMEEKE